MLIKTKLYLVANLVLLPDVVEVNQPVPPLQCWQLWGFLREAFKQNKKYKKSFSLRSSLATGNLSTLGLDLPGLTIGDGLWSFLGVHHPHQPSLTVRSEYVELLNTSTLVIIIRIYHVLLAGDGQYI